MENVLNAVARYALYAAIGYAVIVLAVYLLQRNLLYFPDHTKPSAVDLSTTGMQYWPDKTTYRGFIGTAAPHPVRGTIIAFHGNAGAAWHRDYFVLALAPMGFRVILAEYPGYGGRRGKMNEDALIADAKMTAVMAHKEFGGPIYLLGESMGCAVIAGVAADPPIPVSGLVMITPWDSLANLAQSLYWYLPARWLVKDPYDSVSYLKAFNRPVVIAFAAKDEVIPNKHSLRLYESLNAPKRLWKFNDAGHNSWPAGPYEPWWRETMDFVTAGG